MMENGGDKEDNKVYVYVMSYFDHNIIIFNQFQTSKSCHCERE